MENKKTCCFTGHRAQKLPFKHDERDPLCVRIKQRLREEIVYRIEECGVTHFITGMAMGVDMYAAEIVLELKKDYPFITLEAAIPYEEQAASWAEPLRDRYFSIIEHCDKETMLQTHYTRSCMFVRNRYMVDNSDCVIAVYNEGLSGGTKNTVDYAKKKGKELIIIDPLTC